MHRKKVAALTILLIIFTTAQTKAQTPSPPTNLQTKTKTHQAQTTLDYNPTLGQFHTQTQPPQTFPTNQLHATNQTTTNYPTTIRVRHHPQNTCRNVPANQIDTIPFEEYIARVLPAEVPPSWEPAALQAQAIAIRTYAWRQSLASRGDYDVSDWVNFQHMCDDRFPATDAAVAATTGQYLSAISDPAHTPIVAMYSAENGHPTLTNPNVKNEGDYLQAVPDSYSIGRKRFGHGYGLSQWGAQRRALVGHNYAEILGHYYTNVHLTNAQQPEEMAATLIGVQDRGLLSANGIHWRTLLSTNHAVPPTISLARTNPSASTTITSTVGDWQPSPPIQHQETVTLSLQIGNTILDQKTIRFDTVPPPPPAISAPAIISSASLPITITTAPIVGANPRGRPSQHPTENPTITVGIGQQWIWPGSTFTQTAHIWNSPPINILPADQSYRGLITLRLTQPITQPITQSPLAHITITDLDFATSTNQTLLGLRELWQSDLFTDTQPTTIAIDFHLFQPPRGLRLTLEPFAETEFQIDKFQILHMPTAIASDDPQRNLHLHATQGPTNIYAAAFDSAGNISQIVSQTVQVNDIAPPHLGPISQPTWHTTHPITISIPLTDTLSGIDLQSGAATLSDPQGGLVLGAGALKTTLSQPENPWTTQRTNTRIPNIDDGRYTIDFTIADAAGNIAQTTPIPLRVDTTAPSIALTLSSDTEAWHLTPISFTLTATDTTSGIGGIGAIAYTINNGPTQRYANPVTINRAGRKQIQAWTTDIAGNQSKIVETDVVIDLTAPTIQYSTRTPGPSIIEIAWQATDDASGVSRVQLQQRSGNRWQAIPLADATLTSGNIMLNIMLDVTNVEPIQLRMRAVDQAGRRGTWQTQTIDLPTSWHYFPIIRAAQN